MGRHRGSAGRALHYLNYLHSSSPLHHRTQAGLIQQGLFFAADFIQNVANQFSLFKSSNNVLQAIVAMPQTLLSGDQSKSCLLAAKNVLPKPVVTYKLSLLTYKRKRRTDNQTRYIHTKSMSENVQLCACVVTK